ncbi:hypothetical protein H072_6170 [Dactylellina haptotyla CBS 200.50]|uniref:Aminoglycoside phosphotransferase domain-containing protein n=1 Tax=Dactylellina haptotyla (strain CBS 200.50) TaxID=1284197 RepID=S8BKU5_DACHA|nr:hypothetical protein H072_6170 [Dactylellina haptotyla CBS 200.50]
MEPTAPLCLPYFRDLKELPGTLPTVSEIHAASDRGKGGYKKIVHIKDIFFVKYGPYISQLEAENLLFVEKNLTISAPKLYATWREPDGTLYIVTELLSGDNLAKLWPCLQMEEKDLILSRLREMVQQIRALPAPNLFGSISHGRVMHDLFRIFADDPKANKPFVNEYEFLMALINKIRLDAQDNKRHSYIGDFFERELLPEFIRNEIKHKPTFTHADFHPGNIIVEKRNGKFDISLVDWEASGWYPSYWEYVSAFLTVEWVDDWGPRLGDIIESWPSELAMMKMIYHILWF